MPTGANEYLFEFRKRVCARCVGRPAGGGPCAAQGRNCCVESRTKSLVDAIHKVKNGEAKTGGDDVYRRVFKGRVCPGGADCPCPIRSLLIPIIHAIDTAHGRHPPAYSR